MIEPITKIVAVVLTALSMYLSAFQWASMRRRTKLKADLEILKLLREADPSSEHINRLSHRINTRLVKSYRDPDGPRTDLDRSDLAWGVLLLLAAAISLYFSVRIKSWRLELTLGGILLAIGAVVGIINGFKRKLEKPVS